ncbi:hypothetical protein CB1_001907065 [Camelus ferus]|nr:hypothetical protein CB1_001907065 [Camelus ferus]
MQTYLQKSCYLHTCFHRNEKLSNLSKVWKRVRGRVCPGVRLPEGQQQSQGATCWQDPCKGLPRGCPGGSSSTCLRSGQQGLKYGEKGAGIPDRELRKEKLDMGLPKTSPLDMSGGSG